MAKLTGVQTIDMVNGEITKVTYGGAEYARVDGKPSVEKKAGDIALCTDSRTSFFSANSYYLAVNMKHNVGVTFEDNYGENTKFADMDERVTLFRKISAQATPTIETVNAKVDGLAERVVSLESALENAEAGGKQTPKTEKRHAKVGERILITKDAAVGQTYKLGDVLTVTRANVISKGDVHVEGQPGYVDYNEYEVIVESTDKPAQEITHNGVEYTLVKRKAQAGDVVVIPKGGKSPFFNEGEAYVVSKIAIGGCVTAYGNDGDYYVLYTEEFNRTEANVLVYAPQASAKPEPIREGDIVVITGDSERASKGSGNSVGDIGKVIREGDSGKSFAVDVPGRRKKGNHTAKSEMRHATPAEIGKYEKALEEAEALAKQAAKDAIFTQAGRKPNEYRKGDIVRIRDEYRGYSVNKAGDIGVITKVHHFDNFQVAVDGREGGGNHHCPQNVEIVTFVESRLDTQK